MRFRPFAGFFLIFVSLLLSIGGALSGVANEQAARVDAAALIERVYAAAQNEANAGFSITASGFSFSPSTLDIQVGDTVTWTRASGVHNVQADDGSFSSGAPNGTWTTFSRTFTQAGVARYFCQVHGTSGGGGMAGVINIHTPGTTATPTPTATATPTPTNTPGGTIPPPITPTPQTVVVDTRDFVFAPNSIKIHVGDTVQWQRSAGFHNVRADNNSFNNGPPTNTWTTFSRTFDQVGTFAYHCEEHGAPGGVGMAGVVIVEPIGGSQGPNLYLPIIHFSGVE
jgi:plastocyanin